MCEKLPYHSLTESLKGCSNRSHVKIASAEPLEKLKQKEKENGTQKTDVRSGYQPKTPLKSTELCQSQYMEPQSLS